jgi:hypothetical protein
LLVVVVVPIAHEQQDRLQQHQFQPYQEMVVQKEQLYLPLLVYHRLSKTVPVYQE